MEKGLEFLIIHYHDSNMKVNIPGSSRRILQDNKNQFNGNISESFNLDLTSNRGKIGVTRTKKVADVVKSFGPYTYQVLGISSGVFGLFYAGGDGSLDNIYEGGSSAFSSTFVRDASSAKIGPDEGDLLVVNDRVIVTDSQSFHHTTMDTFGIWTEVTSPALTDNTMHLLTSLGDNVYVTNLHDKIGVIDSSNVLSLTGTSTIDLGLDGYSITVLMSGLDRIWIGVSGRGSRVQNGVCYIYEWDGETENVPNQRYEIDASGLICGVVKDGIPYVLDTNGRLLRYSGASFTEVARLPYKQGEQMYGFDSGTLGQRRAIQPRSITVDGDEILINVSNRLEGDYWADFPSGVWAWSEENGLYHKLSSSYQAVADTGTTNLTDWGQMRVASAGAIFVHNINQGLSIYDTGEGGRIIFAQQYFNSADDETSYLTANDVTLLTAIFADDTKDNTQKFGYFITNEIITDNIEEAWQNLYLKYEQFLNSTDKCVVKYKIGNKEKTIGAINWLDIDRFTTTLDISEYKQGDEVTFIQGYASGKSFHIRSMSEDSGTYTVILDENVQTSCYGKSSITEFNDFKKLGSVEYGVKMNGWKEFPLTGNKSSVAIKFKVCMQFTGNDKIYGIQVNSNENI